MPNKGVLKKASDFGHSASLHKWIPFWELAHSIHRNVSQGFFPSYNNNQGEWAAGIVQGPRDPLRFQVQSQVQCEITLTLGVGEDCSLSEKVHFVNFFSLLPLTGRIHPF